MACQQYFLSCFQTTFFGHNNLDAQSIIFECLWLKWRSATINQKLLISKHSSNSNDKYYEYKWFNYKDFATCDNFKYRLITNYEPVCVHIIQSLRREWFIFFRLYGDVFCVRGCNTDDNGILYARLVRRLSIHRANVKYPERRFVCAFWMKKCPYHFDALCLFHDTGHNREKNMKKGIKTCEVVLAVFRPLSLDFLPIYLLNHISASVKRF